MAARHLPLYPVRPSSGLKELIHTMTKKRVLDVSVVKSSLRLWHRNWTGVVLLVEARETS